MSVHKVLRKTAYVICLSDIPGLTKALIKGNWEFGKNRGALLIMAEPSISRIPAQVLLKHLIQYPDLENKSLVAQVYHCHAYSLYLSEEGENSYTVVVDILSLADHLVAHRQ